jgi:hypothetical protein
MKIIISGIPGDFPSTYTEQFYFTERAVRVGKDTFFVETAKKVQIYGDTSYRKRKIQTVVWDKYTIKFITTESVDIDKILYAKNVYITLDNGEQHTAEIIETPTFEKLGASEFREYTITYRDLGSKQTINHLVYSSTENPDYYMTLKHSSGTKYTPIYPDFGASEWDATTNKDNYKIVVSSESIYKTITGTFYIATSEVPDLLKELSYENCLAGIVSAASAVTYFQISTTKYVPLETPEVSIEDTELEGITPVKITIRYEQTLNYPFN